MSARTGVAVQTREHTLLFDTGPNFSGKRIAATVSLPALRGLGIARLDTLVLSHGDTDHMAEQTPSCADSVVNVISSLPTTHPMLQIAAHNEACSDGQVWNWDGVHFEMLHPAGSISTDSFEHNNERSCVLRISTDRTACCSPAILKNSRNPGC